VCYGRSLTVFDRYEDRPTTDRETVTRLHRPGWPFDSDILAGPATVQQQPVGWLAARGQPDSARQGGQGAL